MLKRILDAKIESVKVLEGADENHPVIKMLAKDPTDSYEAALKDFYRKIRQVNRPPFLMHVQLSCAFLRS